MLRLTEDNVRKLLPMSEAIQVLREAFSAYGRGEAQNQPRRRLRLKTGCTLHQLAGACGNYFGAKIYSSHAKFGAYFTVLLYDAANANPLAEIEANYLGQIRTGAASGLATDLMAKKDASVLAIIGSGFQAQSQLEAMMAVRPIREVRVWSRKEPSRKAFAEWASTRYPHVRTAAVPTAAQAVAGADIVVTATFAKEPVFQHEWLSPAAHVNAMGSNQPDRAEIPPETVRAAKLLVVDDVEQCRIEAGDLLRALKDDEWSRVLPLARLVENESARNASGLTVFKSVGLGLEDIAAGGRVYEKALAATPAP